MQCFVTGMVSDKKRGKWCVQRLLGLSPPSPEFSVGGCFGRTLGLNQGRFSHDSNLMSLSPLLCPPLAPFPTKPTTFPPPDRRPDVEDVKFVINYDYPNSSEDYIHRIGRTARSTNKGTAYTFFTPGNIRQARELIRVLEEARQAINPKLLQLVDSGRGGGGGG